MVSYLGVRKFKNLIKDLFIPGITYSAYSYRRIGGYEFLVGYVNDAYFKISCRHFAHNDNTWIHFEAYDSESSFHLADLVFVIDNNLDYVYPDFDELQDRLLQLSVVTGEVNL